MSAEPTKAIVGSPAFPAAIPTLSLAAVFWRFLGFGAVAWGGPVAQIAMLRRVLVDEGRWVTSEHFNRVLGLYQVLPGPEAHEMCVYFGMRARGRLGGIVAGLGFMLPGFVLMFALSWAYVRYGLDLHGQFATLFAAVQAAVIALIVRAVHRIGSHVLADRWLWSIALLSLVGHLGGVHFALLLVFGGVAYQLAKREARLALAFLTVCAGSLVWWSFSQDAVVPGADELVAGVAPVSPSVLFWSGLKAGLLTFGGAYTVIPFLQRDAVITGAWMSNAQFLDGIALSGLLPAPLIIFATFVGYIGGGALGAILLTIGIFLPAFAFTLLAHEPLERLVRDPRVRTFLDGLTAAVVGLIAATAISLFASGIRSVPAGALFSVALIALFYWKSKAVVPLVVVLAAAIGALATFVAK